MKKLSIIIVNYNVCHFLEQALKSVQKATESIDAEVFVVDNNSVDGSAEMVKAKFPSVILIENKENVGYSKANNQGILQSSGEYILLLNPDTVLEENTLSKCCNFMDKHPKAGALGVKMVDGKGNFLPESKRGLPDFWVSIYKLLSLNKLFPNSKRFGKYYLSYLGQEEIHEVDILVGAFMFMRKKVLDQVGLLDERFFMYWEDTDLSYRITKAGYKNFYYPETTIIHYKGESSKRYTAKFIFIFYRSMMLFVKKHFQSKMFEGLVNAAMYGIASYVFIRDSLQKIALLLLDFSAIYGTMYLLKTYWEGNYKQENFYPPEFLNVVIPIYILIWQTTVYFSGGYNKDTKSIKIVRGVIVGTIIISALSNFFEMYRFSRALIILGGIGTSIVLILIRFLIHALKYKNLSFGEEYKKRVVIVGNQEESYRVIKLINDTGYTVEVIGFISPLKNIEWCELNLGSIEKIKQIIGLYKIQEIIFCSKDLPANSMIELMTSINSKSLEYKIVPHESNYIIGSSFKNSNGEFYTLNVNLDLSRKENLRKKRLLDVGISFLLLFISPVVIWFTEHPLNFYKNIFKVLLGNYTWVGYTAESIEHKLPQLRKGIIHPVSFFKDTDQKLDINTINRLNLLYAKDYKPLNDLNLIFKSLSKLGN